MDPKEGGGVDPSVGGGVDPGVGGGVDPVMEPWVSQWEEAWIPTWEEAWEFPPTTNCLNYSRHGSLYNFACAHGLAYPNLLNTRGQY